MNGAGNYHLLKSMAPTVGNLSQSVEDKADRLARAFLRALELDRRNRRMVESDLADLFARIANIELTLFPNLGRDIAQLRSILGDGEAKAYNPNDYRR